MIDPGRAFGTGRHPTTRLVSSCSQARSGGACSTSAAAPASSRSRRRSSASRPCSRSTSTRRRSRRPNGTPPTTASRSTSGRPTCRGRPPGGGSRAREHRRRGGARACAQAACPARDHIRLPRLRRPAARRLPPRAAQLRTVAGPPICTCGSRFRAHGELLRPFPRLQGLADRRPGLARAAAARRPPRGEGSGDVAVVNTCCVTNEGLAKSRQAASRAARSHARVYVTGCGARLSEYRLRGASANVTVVPGQIEEAAETVAGDVGAIGCVRAEARLDRVRAFVKIQDGCSFSCAFCVIPLVRGATRTRSADAVLGEIRTPRAQGHREIVLTGVNLGCFRDRAAGYDARRPDQRGRCDRRRRAAAPLVDRDQPCRRRARRRAARHAGRRPRTCTSRSSPATTAC